MQRSVEELFKRYAEFFRKGLANEADMDEVVSSYADAFVAASPAGVISGRNDEGLKAVMTQGFERYRQQGTTGMTLRNLRIHSIDANHCLAHVGWTATYKRKDSTEVAIDFEVHYLVQQLSAEPKIFGWVSGDEQALLKEHGIV